MNLPQNVSARKYEVFTVFGLDVKTGKNRALFACFLLIKSRSIDIKCRYKVETHRVESDIDHYNSFEKVILEKKGPFARK